ncbi:MAG: hypothetical protein PHQ81_06025 [Methanofollis sp.]|nr:hypothetical protein [Methanofollis sp.]
MRTIIEHIPKLTGVVENDLELNFFVPEFLNPILHQGGCTPLTPRITIGRGRQSLFIDFEYAFPTLSSSLGSGGSAPGTSGVGRHEGMVGQRREGGFLHHIQCSLLRRERTGGFWDMLLMKRRDLAWCPAS